jgi:Flp pilus assembly pilin Flp
MRRGGLICNPAQKGQVVVPGANMRHQKGERGQGLVEYALLIALVAIIAVAALSMMGRSLHTIPLRDL